MAKLVLHSNEVQSVFQLLGHRENDISFSVAWALSKCPYFLREFLYSTVGWTKEPSRVEIRLQEHEGKRGFTDIEIELKDQFYIIVEAKRGWILPGAKQLKKYAKRKSFLESRAPRKKKCLVVMSECSKEYSKVYLGIEEIKGTAIKAVSWGEMAAMAKKSVPKSSNADKRLIKELLTYLRGLMTMQKIDSNLVYVVALGHEKPRGWRINYWDVVEKKSLYFHPVGGSGWPKDPPNYIAFRYAGVLKSIHHVKSYKVVENMHKHIREIPRRQWRPHFLYKLGPAIRPPKVVRTGRIFRNGRVWCMLDTLLTCKTISKARDLTKQRKKEQV